MLILTKWANWQRPALKEVKTKRKKRGTDPSRPYSLPWFAMAGSFDDNGGKGSFQTFAELVGGRFAETFWVRILQYVSLHDPFRGTIAVSRSRFGPVVLARAWDAVGAKGGIVYDALLRSGLAEEIEPNDPRLSVDTSEDKSVDAAGIEERRGDTSPSPSSASPSSNGHHGRSRGSELAEQLRILYRNHSNASPVGRLIDSALAARSLGEDDRFHELGYQALDAAKSS